MENRINEIITSKGLKKKYVAEKIGISPNQLSNWINGKSLPTVQNLFKLAALLGVKAEDLYIDEEKTKDI